MLLSQARLRDGTAVATVEAVEAFLAHAIAVYPEECIGYLDAAGAYVPLKNMAADPQAHAIPERRALAAAMQGNNLRALCHSHPGGPDCPSEADMRTQMEMEIPFAIVATNGEACMPAFAWGDELLDDGPLVGRSFRHGVTDCYAMIRAWYRVECGVDLPDYPRNWEWWRPEQVGEKDLYRRYFADAGFVEADRATAREGDVWLAAIRSEVPNHAGVYLGDGLALHHPSSGLENDPGRLSKRESIARWSDYITHWLRRP
jgi:cell wall-associated NlpC family hydrolase